MITCLGLVVGMLTSADRNETLKQCAEFIKAHQYLLSENGECSIPFEINGYTYCTAIDTDRQTGFAVLFQGNIDYWTTAVMV